MEAHEPAHMCLQADLTHACFVLFDAEKKAGGRPHRWPVPQMAQHVLSFLMMPPVERRVCCGDFYTCVVDACGRLYCSGENNFRQCEVPAGLGRVTQVASVDSHTCAIDGAGRLHCFGSNKAQPLPSSGL